MHAPVPGSAAICAVLNGQVDATSMPVEVTVDRLIIAGWTGRDAEAVEHHIAELAARGVARPQTVPCYYRAAASLLTPTKAIEVLGEGTSGEAEPLLIATEDHLWVGLVSDHTDRAMECTSVAASKQICAKPMAPTVWRFDDVEPHWDQLILRSFIKVDGERLPYQDGTLVQIREPRNLIAGVEGGNRQLRPGSAMLCGTIPTIGGLRPADRFEMELSDPVLGRTIAHAYDVITLPIVD